MKIVIIHDEPLTKKIKRNYFIDEFIENGFSVEYWGVHKFMYGNLSLVDEQQDVTTHIVSSYKELSDKIKNSDADFYIIEYAYTLKGFLINHLLCKNKCRCAQLGIHTSVNLTTKEKLSNFKSYGWSKVLPFIKKLMERLLIKILGTFLDNDVKNIGFYCGSESLRQYQDFPVKVPINSFDYEDFLLSEKVEKKIDATNYIVFLDEYMAYHPDVLLWGKPVTPEKYYSSLNIYFKYLEDKLCMPVVIAAHPKSDYKEETFEGRRIIKYETARLVRHSSLVLGHDSLSISFPVLNYKPIVFIYTNEFANTGLPTMIYMRKMSALLNRPLVNINDSRAYEALDGLFDVDKSSYDKYKFSYLTSPDSMDRKSADIICSIFANLKSNERTAN